VKRWTVPLALSAALLQSGACEAQEYEFGDRLIAAYAKLESYCDTGTSLAGAGQPVSRPSTFERCVHRDGRFKTVVEQISDFRFVSATWSDGEQIFGFYASYPDNHLYIIGYTAAPLVARARSDDVAPSVRLILQWFQISDEADPRPLREQLRSYLPRPDLSLDDLIAYQATDYTAFGSHPTVWISRTDGLIRRVVRENLGGTEVTRVRLNSPLSREDLWFDAPLRARASLWMRQHVALSAAALSVVAFLVGWAYWSRRRSEIAGIGTQRERRRRAWRSFGIFSGVSAGVIVAIVALGSGYSGGGDMPAGLVLIPVGALLLFALWLAACFLAARHLAERPRRPSD